VYYGGRWYHPETGRWASRDPSGEKGGVNLYANGNDFLNHYDPNGLAWMLSTFVAKSFINSFPQAGSLYGKNPNPLLGPTPGYEADERMASLMQAVKNNPGFNDNPITDAEDGRYRLYTKIEMKACVGVNNVLALTITTDQDGGTELPFISGSIDLSYRKHVLSPSEIDVEWMGWGHPNAFVEPQMQIVAMRTSINIWHDVTVNVKAVNGKPQIKLKTVTQSAFPSVRVWQDGGNPIYYHQQGPFSALWEPRSDKPSFAAP
jgi:hypothetical protein